MAHEYTVLAIDEMMVPGDLSGVQRLYRHRIKTKGGTRLTVDISEADFTEDKAPPILLKAAQNADKIKASGG